MMTSTMDRISNKFKLVRSQSIGVGMGGEGGKVGVRAEGRPAQIVLLDERRVELALQPRLYAGELLDLVASQCALKVGPHAFACSMFLYHIRNCFVFMCLQFDI
jgi:hypothetical protein